MFTAQRVHVAPNHEVSPRIKLLLFSIYLGVTFAIVKLWMVIIKEENVYYETAAAFATIFVLTTILWLYYQLVRKHRERQEEIRRRNRISSPELNNAAIETIHRRLLMRRAYGENVDFFMEGGAGLSAEIINNLLHHSIYSTDSVSCKPTAHVNWCGGIECGCVVEHNKIETQSATTTTGPATTTFTDTDIAAVRTTPTGVTTDGTAAATCTHHECAVCLSEYLTGDSITELPCGHVYHRTCITSWLLSRNLCPMCKQLAVPADLLDASLESQLAMQAAADIESGVPNSARGPYSAVLEHMRRPPLERNQSANSVNSINSVFSLQLLPAWLIHSQTVGTSTATDAGGGDQQDEVDPRAAATAGLLHSIYSMVGHSVGLLRGNTRLAMVSPVVDRAETTAQHMHSATAAATATVQRSERVNSYSILERLSEESSNALPFTTTTTTAEVAAVGAGTSVVL